MRERLASLRAPMAAEEIDPRDHHLLAALAMRPRASCLSGWFLPWFVNDYAAGAGYSPQDAVVSAPTGVGTFFIYIMAVTMLIIVLAPARRQSLDARAGRYAGPRADGFGSLRRSPALP